MGVIEKNVSKFIAACDNAGRQVGGPEIVDLIKTHCVVAAGAAVASGWVPGAGGSLAMLTAAGNVWTMYYRINELIGVQFGTDMLKGLATGIAMNIGGSFVAGVAVASLFSLVPGIGSLAASASVGAIAYSVTLASGVIYMNIMTELFNAGINPNSVSAEELESMAKEAAEDIDIDAIKRAGKAGYNQSKTA